MFRKIFSKLDLCKL